MEPTLPLLMRVPRAPFPFPLKLLAEAEGEELLEDEDDAELTEGVDVDPAVLALEPEPDLENSHELQGQAIGNTHADSPDDVEDPELVEVMVAPMLNEPLVAITELTLLLH
jgi:hypothetical protein